MQNLRIVEINTSLKLLIRGIPMFGYLRIVEINTSLKRIKRLQNTNTHLRIVEINTSLKPQIMEGVRVGRPHFLSH